MTKYFQEKMKNRTFRECEYNSIFLECMDVIFNERFVFEIRDILDFYLEKSSFFFKWRGFQK